MIWPDSNIMKASGVSVKTNFRWPQTHPRYGGTRRNDSLLSCLFVVLYSSAQSLVPLDTPGFPYSPTCSPSCIWFSSSVEPLRVWYHHVLYFCHSQFPLLQYHRNLLNLLITCANSFTTKGQRKELSPGRSVLLCQVTYTYFSLQTVVEAKPPNPW